MKQYVIQMTWMSILVFLILGLLYHNKWTYDHLFSEQRMDKTVAWYQDGNGIDENSLEQIKDITGDNSIFYYSYEDVVVSGQKAMQSVRMYGIQGPISAYINLPRLEGRWMEDNQLEIVLTKTVAVELFGAENTWIGQKVSIESKMYQVVGIIEDDTKWDSLWPSGKEIGMSVLVPYNGGENRRIASLEYHGREQIQITQVLRTMNSGLVVEEYQKRYEEFTRNLELFIFLCGMLCIYILLYQLVSSFVLLNSKIRKWNKRMYVWEMLKEEKYVLLQWGIKCLLLVIGIIMIWHLVAFEFSVSEDFPRNYFDIGNWITYLKSVFQSMPDAAEGIMGSQRIIYHYAMLGRISMFIGSIILICVGNSYRKCMREVKNYSKGAT